MADLGEIHAPACRKLVGVPAKAEIQPDAIGRLVAGFCVYLLVPLRRSIRHESKLFWTRQSDAPDVPAGA